MSLSVGSVNSVDPVDCVDSAILANSFTGISQAQSEALVQKAHIYLTSNGRISMAGLNSGNIK